MLKAVWKFPLEITDSQTIIVPEGTQFLDAQMQSVSPCIWGIVEQSAAVAHLDQKRTIRIVGTGQWFEDEEWDRIATVQMYGGTLVWHIFEAA